MIKDASRWEAIERGGAPSGDEGCDVIRVESEGDEEG